MLCRALHRRRSLRKTTLWSGRTAGAAWRRGRWQWRQPLVARSWSRPSYALAASSAAPKVPSQSRAPRRRSHICAVYLPLGARCTPRNPRRASDGPAAFLFPTDASPCSTAMTPELEPSASHSQGRITSKPRERGPSPWFRWRSLSPAAAQTLLVGGLLRSEAARRLVVAARPT